MAKKQDDAMEVELTQAEKEAVMAEYRAKIGDGTFRYSEHERMEAEASLKKALHIAWSPEVLGNAIYRWLAGTESGWRDLVLGEYILGLQSKIWEYEHHHAGEVMTDKHPRWMEFCEAVAEKIEDRCDGSYKCAGTVLMEWGGFDILKSVDFFEANGGGCDCEILMNIMEIA